MSLHPHPLLPLVPAGPLVALRVSVRCDSVAAFSERYWRLVKDDRILIVANRQRAPGTRIRFHITLSDGSDALRGEGRVVRMRKTPRGAEWVELQFVPLDEPSKKLVAVLQALRSAHGKAPHTAGAGLEFDEASPTSQVNREAFEEFDEKKATDRIDREQLNQLLASTPSPARAGQAQPPPLPPIPQPPMPPPPPDGVLSALTPEGPMLDEEDLEPYIEEWQVLPTGKVRKITRGEMLISPVAPMPAVDPDEAVQVGEIVPRTLNDLKEGIAAERRKKRGSRTALLVLGMMLGIALGLFAALWLMHGRPTSLRALSTALDVATPTH